MSSSVFFGDSMSSDVPTSDRFVVEACDFYPHRGSVMTRMGCGSVLDFEVPV